MLKTVKIPTIAPTCFGSRRNHHQGPISCLANTTIMILLCSSLMTWSMLWRHTSLLCKRVYRRATLARSPLGEWSFRRRDHFLTTHNTHKTNTHAGGGIRTHSLRKRVAADLRLRPPQVIVQVNYMCTVHRGVQHCACFVCAPAVATFVHSNSNTAEWTCMKLCSGEYDWELSSHFGVA